MFKTDWDYINPSLSRNSYFSSPFFSPISYSAGFHAGYFFSIRSRKIQSLYAASPSTAMLNKEVMKYLRVPAPEECKSSERALKIRKIKEYNRRAVKGSVDEIINKLDKEFFICQKYLNKSYLNVSLHWNLANPHSYVGRIFQRTIACGGGLAQLLGSRHDQQDFYTADEITLPHQREPIYHFGIYDGHCGPDCAHFLSSRASKYFEDEFCKEDNLDERVMMNILKVAYVHLGEQYRREFRKKIKPAVRDAEWAIPNGSAATSFFIGFKRLYVANVGDCRVGLFIGKPLALSNDAKLWKKKFREEVERRGGKVESASKKSDFVKFETEGYLRKLRVPRSVGHPPTSGIHARAGVTGILLSDLPEGDHWIISASDGLWDVVSTQALSDYINKLIEESEKLGRKITGKEIAAKIAKKAYVSDPDHADNITVMAVPLVIRHETSFETPFGS